MISDPVPRIVMTTRNFRPRPELRRRNFPDQNLDQSLTRTKVAESSKRCSNFRLQLGSGRQRNSDPNPKSDPPAHYATQSLCVNMGTESWKSSTMRDTDSNFIAVQGSHDCARMRRHRCAQHYFNDQQICHLNTEFADKHWPQLLYNLASLQTS